MRPRDVHRYDFFNNADFELLDIGIPRTEFERLCDYLRLDRAIFDTPELPLHCVLSGHTLTDVQEKLLNTNRFADNETACRYILSLFPYLVQLFLTAPAPEAILPAWFSELLEKMERRENYITGLPYAVVSPLHRHDADGVHQRQAIVFGGAAAFAGRHARH